MLPNRMQLTRQTEEQLKRLKTIDSNYTEVGSLFSILPFY